MRGSALPSAAIDVRCVGEGSPGGRAPAPGLGTGQRAGRASNFREACAPLTGEVVTGCSWLGGSVREYGPSETPDSDAARQLTVVASRLAALETNGSP